MENCESDKVHLFKSGLSWLAKLDVFVTTFEILLFTEGEIQPANGCKTRIGDLRYKEITSSYASVLS